MDNGPKITSASVSDRGLSEKRPENEDSYLEMPRSGIFAVADGVGGAQAGEVASQMAMEILGEAFANLPPSTDAETAMRAAIERANTAIFQMAHELPQLAAMATTIAAVHIKGNIATIGHVGDSRVYRVNRDGEIFRETADHSMVAEEVRAGRMTEEQAENHPSKNIISRALGAEAAVEPELKTIMIEPGTAFMLCSDGVTRHVGDQEIRGVLTFGGSPQDVCEYVKNLCMERGAEDNFTAVVVKLADGPKPSETLPAPAPVISAASDPFDAPAYLEESTVATARIPTPIPEVDDDDLLGIDVEGGFPETPAPVVTNDTIHVIADNGREDRDDRTAGAGVSRFDYGSDNGSEEKSNGSVGTMAGALAMLIVGALAGIGVYHLMFVRPWLDEKSSLPPITEMQTRNQQVSAFEDNRRTVDLKPAEALRQFGADPRDAADYFLVGRAHMLLGNYVAAREAFTQARTLLRQGGIAAGDAKNAPTLEIEIAFAMAMLDNTTSQTILRNELATVQGAGLNSETNTNTSSAPR